MNNLHINYDISQKIKNAINSKDYDFLRNNPDLSNISYLVLSGSLGYGTNNENSDIDLRGALLENKKYIYGLDKFEQFIETETDTVIYGLQKFVKLCCESNPNVIELLGVDDDCVVIMDDVGKYMRENHDMFLSKKVIKTFGNFATAQLRRMQNAICHDTLEDADRLKHIKNSLDSQMEHFKRNYTKFGDNAIEIVVNEKSNELCFNVDLKEYPIQDFVSIYGEMSNTLKNYNKLNKRNTKKDDAHIYKHAMHLVRILITGTDILNGKGVITKRVDEHDLLMDIRNGHYSYEEIFRIAEDFDKLFQDAAKNTKLQDEPDMYVIKKFLCDMYSKKLNN